MTVSENTQLLPKEYQKSYVVPIPPMELNNNSRTSSNTEHGPYALSKDELTKYIDDPHWMQVRKICFSAYWLMCLIALGIACYITVSALENGFCDNAVNGGNSWRTDNVTAVPVTRNNATTQPPALDMADSARIIFRVLSQPT